jgi:Ni,Fe-hydrogenase I small subunit
MQRITRRAFLRFCTGAAAGLGLTAEDLLGLREALANPLGPSVIWLQGSGCSGCTISFDPCLACAVHVVKPVSRHRVRQLKFTKHQTKVKR